MSSPFHLGVDAKAVEAALQNYLTHPDEGAGELLRFAQLHHVLPLWTDWMGCIALRPTGQLVFFAWDDPEKVQPVGAGGHRLPMRRLGLGTMVKGGLPNQRLKLAGPAFRGSVRLCASDLVPQG